MKIARIQGSFWQREYPDHLLRNENEFEGTISYVVENPVSAGLEGWQWVRVRGQDALVTTGGTPALL